MNYGNVIAVVAYVVLVAVTIFAVIVCNPKEK